MDKTEQQARLAELNEKISKWPKSQQNLLDDCLNPHVPERQPFPNSLKRNSEDAPQPN